MKTLSFSFILALLTFGSFATSGQAKNYTDLEEALRNPDKVEVLILADKKLTTFPTEIFELKNLEYLDLSDNRLTALPENIGSLTELFYLDLSGNTISSLPEDITIATRRKFNSLIDGERKNQTRDACSSTPCNSGLRQPSNPMRSGTSFKTG